MGYLVAIMFTAVALVFAARRACSRPRSGSDDAWLPADMRGAPIAYAEKTFRSTRHRLVSRLDRAYRLATGYRLVEFKTRRRHVTYDSDVIELSAQRIALAEETGQPVDERALVVSQVGTERQVHYVRLSPEAEVVKLMRRRQGILDGTIEPDYAARRGICKNCEFVRECRPDQHR